MSVCVRVCMYNVCSCASSSAISRAQSLKLFSKETTIKRETPTIPFLWFFFPFFSSSHLSHSPSFFLALLTSSSLSVSTAPFLSLSLAPPSSSPSLSAPVFKRPPLPSCTPWQQPRQGARRRKTEIDKRCLRRSCGSCTVCLSDTERMAGLIWPAHCSPLTTAASQHQGVGLRLITTTGLRNQYYVDMVLMRGTPLHVYVCVLPSFLL